MMRHMARHRIAIAACLVVGTLSPAFSQAVVPGPQQQNAQQPQQQGNAPMQPAQTAPSQQGNNNPQQNNPAFSRLPQNGNVQNQNAQQNVSVGREQEEALLRNIEQQLQVLKQLLQQRR